jgi:ABC-type Na+ efflux pump permease subunit
MNKLKKRWGIKSNIQIGLILLVFALNGSVSAILNRLLLKVLNITSDSLPNLIYYLIYFIVLTILYFSLLAITSRLFGQGKFFKDFAKRSLKPFGLQNFIL